MDELEGIKNYPHLEGIIKNIPSSPGCYLFFDENGVIIYIGKAKDLKRRVSSYFNKNQTYAKTRILVRKIRNIEYIVVESEQDAFLLENNMIKEHQPRYNIMLKDDKTYPWIVVKNEPFPRVFSTRTVIKDKSLYFGPYSSVPMVKVLLKLIRSIYPLRTCNLVLTPERINQGKYKVCLQYHIKNCLGPCEKFQSQEDYDKNIAEIIQILKGNISQLSDKLFDEMKDLSQQLKFEEAHRIKEKYLLIENYKAKSVVASMSIDDIDVFSLDENGQSVYINYLHIRNGLIVRGYTFEYKRFFDEPKEEVLAYGIIEMRSRFQSEAKEIIVPFLPDIELAGVTMTVPQRGEKHKLLILSKKNVHQYKVDKLKQSEQLNIEQRKTRVITTLKNDLHLSALPVHIECFDNSNIQGTNPVSACVVFKNGKPSKKDYRHFNVRTVDGPNDFQSMYECVYRRYERLKTENEPLPQLIVVDGGKGQLSSAVQALKNLDLYGKIAIIGIAERLEEIYFPNDSIPLYLDKNSESLKLIQQLRDEAHRFAITFHRKKRSKQQTKSELDEIKGIGEKTKMILLNKFGSVKQIKDTPFEKISELIGENRAKILMKALNP
ncbi:MAG: excinuclease ABC subunit UvrC [Dysgonamonadaceae bacterium]|jgi:excinuclease ABC subunit C|nr:excinuclease ABC subunit UvrC [Dysgonamonadaceae bacterium]